MFFNKKSKSEYLLPLNEEKVDLNKSFSLREKFFYKKKKPKSESYPFEIINPFDVFGENDVYGDFYLIGDEWRNKNSDKPVAICWGFNDWKFGFVAEYLKDYRVAFAPRKILALPSLVAVKRFPIEPSAFFFWGYTEPPFVKYYAKEKKIEVFRMEDGFVRSAMLGASHATPYSLVVDSSGLYYNPDVPSDIENILNYHSFSMSEIEISEKCLNFFRDNDISKYNPPHILEHGLSKIKLKRRIAILGQVDSDMSIKMGNLNGWSTVDLIRLARKENPDADIYYRPHPDVYQGYQQSSFKKKSVEDICQISSPEIPIRNFLETIDHVYTISSLSGLEALLLGIKVTVVGAAFYAGWGLTDDRIRLERRERKISLLEMFFAVYLKYPRYLAGTGDLESVFYATILRIKADQSIENFSLACEMQKTGREDELARSNYWPRLVFTKSDKQSYPDLNLAVDSFSEAGRIYQIFYVYAVCGALRSGRAIEKFLASIRSKIDVDIFNQLLLDLHSKYPGEYLVHQFSWLISEAGGAKESLRFLNEELGRIQVSEIEKTSFDTAVGKSENIDPQGSSAEDEFVVNQKILTAEKAGILYHMFEQALSLKKYDEAVEYGKILLLDNFFVTKLVEKFSRIAELRFDNKSAQNLARFGQKIDLYAANRATILLEARNYSSQLVVEDPEYFLQLLVKMVTLKPDLINAAVFFAKKYKEILGGIDVEEILSISLHLDNEQSIRKALGFIAIEKPENAIKILENLIFKGDESDSLKIAYSQALSFSGRIEEAILLIKNSLKNNKTSANYRELLRLLVIAGRYDQSLLVIGSAKKERIHLGDMHLRKAYFGNRMVKAALETFKEIRLCQSVAMYYPDRYMKDIASSHEGLKILLLAIFGPGDEIRFASIYNLISKYFKGNAVSISCEPRLLNIFSRSFEGIKFVGVPRPRSSDYVDYRNYERTPGSDLMGVIDNNAHEAIISSDKILMVTDMLSECLSGYDAFPGVSYLLHDENLSVVHKAKLPKNKKLVGLSWRSSLTTHSRNEHYLTIEELEPLFLIPDIQFINFQYDECQEELDWVEQRYPGKLIDIPQIDHYNDFDSVAALMKCMDLMIAPATTVVELAGALGCPTWMISNSSELHWRKIDHIGTDVWHNSVIHVEGASLGNKKSLVEEIVKKLRKFE